MIPTIFPCLPGSTLSAVNTVGQWLAQDDLQPGQSVDMVILAGMPSFQPSKLPAVWRRSRGCP